MTKSKPVLIDTHPGRNSQAFGIARELGTETDLIHQPSVGVIGNKGDSQCYIGVQPKVEAIHACLKDRIGSGEGKLALRLVQPEYTVATSDGIRNGTREMRYSLIGREVTQDSLCEHLSASGLAGTIAVVACDKPPVGTLAALLEHDQPAIIMSDGSIHPGRDPQSNEKLDIVSAYQAAGHPEPEHRFRIACNACPGIGSCGGMFTYNTMQTFIGVVGMQPLHMVAPPSDDPRRLNDFPAELVGYLEVLMARGITPPRHRHPGCAQERRDRRHGGGWLDQRGTAHARDRPGRRLRELLGGHHDARGVQSSVAARGAGADRCSPLWPVLDG